MVSSEYVDLLKRWGIAFAESENSLKIAGSPERSASRVILSDTMGSRWILEEIEEGNLSRKRRVAECLQGLSTSGLDCIHPWRRNRNGSCISVFQDRNWMIRPFVEGVPLDRKTYLDALWRVDALADFLMAFRPCSTGKFSGKTFSISTYAEGCMEIWREKKPYLAEQLESSFSRLKQGFFPVHDRLPVAFCHGDYHPLNVVWGERGIRSVIDWEFCGIKPELYDVALLLGCFGFDDPDYLIQEPTIRLVKNLRGAGFGEAVSWECLLELMVSIRYGWMSEWIRRKDLAAIKMETIYMDILVDQKEYILQHW